MAMVETDVLVVGAGLTGATTALLLARHGVRALMVSRGRWVADSPRAHIVNQRTMEVVRAVGLEASCEAAATPGELMANWVMVTSLAGREFGRVWSWGNNPARQGDYLTSSPGRVCDLPQDRFEPILVGEALRLGATARFDTTFVDLEQDEDGVTSVLEDRITGARYRVRSRYVVGADGGQSPVAAAAGLPLHGESGLAPALNVRFTADLTRHVAHRPGSLYWVLQPGRPGPMANASLRMVRPWTEWVAGFTHLGESVADLSHDQLTAELRELIEDDSVEITVRGVYPWRINHVIAERYGNGRVLCGGDAVHRHPPMNALGGNTCIQDAFNLAWKIAAVLRWGAGPALLDSYTDERRPVGQQIVDRAIATWRQVPEIVRALGIDPASPPAVRQAQFDELFADTDAGEAKRVAFDKIKQQREYAYQAHGVEMNQVYTSSAVVDDGSPPLVYDRDPELHHVPSARPGSRVPHCWVEHAGRTCSTIDLAGPERFTLLTRARGACWQAAAESVAEELSIPLVALRVGPGGEVADLYGDWARLSGVRESGCVLVRPDHHVAWRSADAPADTHAALRTALVRCLSLTVAG